MGYSGKRRAKIAPFEPRIMRRGIASHYGLDWHVWIVLFVIISNRRAREVIKNSFPFDFIL
jgi:hypothetical protein